MAVKVSSATELTKLLEAGELSSRDIMVTVLDQIERKEPEIKAFLNVRDRGELIGEAESVDRRRAAGEKVGVLAGLPIAVKDNMCAQGMPTTCASRMLESFLSPYDATVVARIREADGIIVGKTNMDEFSMGSSTENSAYQVTRNPHNYHFVPGGTSGGSAAAVAAGECVLALGSDTGGSIRQPASFCGVVGLKPTYGRVSRYGLIAYGSSLDQIGCLTKTVDDAALLLSAIAGYDPRDSTSINQRVPGYPSVMNGKRSYRFGVPNEYFAEGLDAEVRQSVEKAIELLRHDGHEIVPIRLPHTEYAVPTYYIIACAEASANLARFDGVRYGFRAQNVANIGEMYQNNRSLGFGREVQRRIMLGTYVLSSGYYDAYYLKAQRVRTLIKRDFDDAFKKCDIIVHPEAPTAAFRIGEKTDDPLAMYLGDIYSVVANLVGLPAISVPCGRTSSGLPIGVQLAAKPLGEPQLLAGASNLENLLKLASIWPSPNVKPDSK